jgi:hypothetical protein
MKKQFRLYYLRFYSHSMNCHERFLWTAETRESLDEQVALYEGDTSYKVQVVRFICTTDTEVGENL